MVSNPVSRVARLRRAVWLPLLFFLAGAFLAACVSDKEPDGGSVGAGDRCPAFSVTVSDGSVFDSSELGGRKTMLVFFNTSCPDCRNELPVVQRVWERTAGSVTTLCISRSEPASAVSRYWGEQGLSVPWSAQDTDSVYRLFASSGIPRIYVVSPDGLVTGAFSDTDMPSEATLLEALE